MKKWTILLFALGVVFGVLANNGIKPLNADEAKNIDLSGKWTGKRYQYNQDKTGFIQVFQYEFELKQEGNQITGYSTIINQNGDYADVLLKGIIIGNQLHFEEYQIKSQAKPDDRVWCYKYGQLTIGKSGDALMLNGKTESKMADFGFPCTGGVTSLAKLDNSTNSVAPSISIKEDLGDGMNIAVSPNPFVETTQIIYTLKSDSKVSVEVMDMSGKLLAQPEQNSAKAAGTYAVDYSTLTNSSGIMIAKVTINGQVYSRQMLQIK